MTNQLASLARRDYFYLDAFWRINLGMYIINVVILGMETLETRNSRFTHCMSNFSIISRHNIQCSLHVCLNCSNILIANDEVYLQCSSEITISKFAHRICTICIYASLSGQCTSVLDASD